MRDQLLNIASAARGTFWRVVFPCGFCGSRNVRRLGRCGIDNTGNGRDRLCGRGRVKFDRNSLGCRMMDKRGCHSQKCQGDGSYMQRDHSKKHSQRTPYVHFRNVGKPLHHAVKSIRIGSIGCAAYCTARNCPIGGTQAGTGGAGCCIRQTILKSDRLLCDSWSCSSNDPNPRGWICREQSVNFR